MFYYIYDFADTIPFFNIFRYITFRTGGALITSFVITLVLGTWMIKKLKIWNKNGQPIRKDGPEGHILRKKHTPTMGGIIILASFIISIALWSNVSNLFVQILLFVTFAFGGIGLLDDYIKVTGRDTRGLSVRFRLFFESMFALIAAVFISYVLYGELDGGVYVPFLKDYYIPLGGFSIFFSAIVIVASSNSVNLTDGLDGLAIVPVMIAVGCFGFIAYLAGNFVFAEYLQLPFVSGAGEAAVVAGAVIGAGLGFLWYNAPPAQIFMGDTGSLALGALLGTIAVIIHHELILIIVGGVFVIETLSVLLQIISFKLTGKRIFRMAPIHHHFEKKGWSEATIVIRFWIISFVLALIGLSNLKIR